jgi:hypothetical protein
MAQLRMRKTALLLLAVLVVLAMAASGPARIGDSVKNRQTIVMAKPDFLTGPETADSTISDRLDQEAGISAWFKSPDPINLTNAATAFRVIETQNADYIIGSVALTGYSEHYDAHVYVHKDGWILAYYLKQDLVSKIVNIRASTVNSTNLQSIISTVAGASGVALGAVSHYDFRYPNATHILMVYEDDENGNTFTIKLPGTYGFYDHGFALKIIECCYVFNIDGTNMTSTYWNADYGYGLVPAANLLPDVTHTITVHDHGALVIVYREQ